MYAEQQRLAVTDGLTGLPNRRRFDAELERELDRGARFQRFTALVLLDIDNFKNYNDTYGHPAGDEALRAFGRLLMNSVRAVDLPARYGGEEFALILPETDLEAAREVVEHLRLRTANGDMLPRPFTLSLGIAVAPAHASTPEALVQAADRALYAAKAAGKNRVMAYP